MEKEIAKRFLKGIPASPGIVIGKACVFQDILLLVEKRPLEEGHAEKEIARLKQAIRQVIDELIQDNLRISQEIGKREAEIFLSHVAILEDPYFISQIFQDIRENGINAEASVLRQINEFKKVFEKMDDPYIKTRSQDLGDIGRRVIQKLMPSEDNICDLEEPIIVVASELTPSDTIRLDREKVLAFATESGGQGIPCCHSGPFFWNPRGRWP
jgi:phosphoenolpyruvate-protein phosphotransferase (PTS system enzyme I)